MTWKDHGKRPGPAPKRPKGRQTCTFDGCEKPNHSGGLCSTHNMQRRRGVELRAIRPARPEGGEGMRWCGRCKQFRDEEQFGWDRTREQPRRTCRPCHADMMRSHNAANKGGVRASKMKGKYGLTTEQYETLWVTQSGRCAICADGLLHRSEDGDLRDRVAIDHCHETGEVHGLLCGPCNKGLGFFKDDPVVMRAAIAYLEARRDVEAPATVAT